MSPAVYLKQWRVRKSLSYRGLAKLSGVALSSIQKIEAGRVSPTVETLERLASALGLGFHTLFKMPPTKRKGESR